MIGIITGKTIIKHSFLIIHEFGFLVYSKCLYEIITGHNTTFVSVACKCDKKDK